MSDENRSAGMGQWGRPMRRRVKYAAPQSAASDRPPVGPVDDPALLERAAVIVRADRPKPSATPAEVIGAPRAAATPRAPRDPDEHDFRLRDLVVLMAKGLVDHPEDVSVEIVDAGDGGELELRVHEDDMGHVIGKQGRTARSLRLALGAAAGRIDRRMGLEIAD